MDDDEVKPREVPKWAKDALELVENEDLVNALMSRFQDTIFVGMKAPDDEKKPAVRGVMWRYKGNHFTCIGAAMNMVHLLNTEIEDDLDHLEPGEL